MKNKWYVAILIVRCRVGDQASDFLIDEQIRVIRAPDTDSAHDKALQLGRQEEHDYLNQYGDTVYWEFMGLAELEELESTIRDGTEIRSRFLHHDDPASLVTPRDSLYAYLCLRNAQKNARLASDSTIADR